MLLAIDIGNSLTKFAIFEGPRLVTKFSIKTRRDYTTEELLFDRLRLFEKHFIQVDIDTCTVSSVVADMNPVIASVCKELFSITALFIDSSWDLGFTVEYDPPDSVGTDRLVNCFAAAARFGFPAIVCSFGTATTFDVVTEDRRYIGGLIMPGVGSNAKALHLAAPRLPEVTLEWPADLIGNTTESAIRSGVINGHIFMTEGILARLKGNATVVAAGGFGSMMANAVDAIDHYDENLTMEGIRLLTDRRSGRV